MDTERYLTLRDRAVHYLEQAGGVADEAALVRHVFAAEPAGPWRQLLQRILAGDERLAHGPDGRWWLRRATEPPVGDVPMDFVALELGLMGSRGRRLQIVEVAALRVRGGRIIARLVQAVQPSRRPTAYARRAAGLDVDVFDAVPPFAAVADDLVAFVGRDVLVGYDLTPQLAALATALRGAGRSALANPAIDLLSWLVNRGDLAGKPTLAAALRRCGCGDPPCGRAVDRALAIVALAGALRERSSSSATATHGVTRPAPGQRSIATAVTDAPAAPGVYLLRDAAGAVLYVGAARNLRQRLRSYGSLAIRRTRRMEGLHERVARVEWQTMPSELSARLREAELIAEHRPPYNVARRVVGRPMYIVARAAGLYVRLVVAAQPLPGERCAGPFTSARATRHVWRVLADLCRLDTCRRTFRARRRPPCPRHTSAALCPAPCVGAVAPEAYAERVDRALAFLAGERAAVLADLQAAAAVGKDDRRTETARLARLVALAQRLPVVAVDVARPELVAGLVPASAYAGGDALAAELFCLRDGVLYPLQPVARPEDAAEIERACAAALAAAPLAAAAAAVARAWLRQRPGAAVTARTTDLSSRGIATLAAALRAAYSTSTSMLST